MGTHFRAALKIINDIGRRDAASEMTDAILQPFGAQNIAHLGVRRDAEDLEAEQYRKPPVDNDMNWGGRGR